MKSKEEIKVQFEKSRFDRTQKRSKTFLLDSGRVSPRRRSPRLSRSDGRIGNLSPTVKLFAFALLGFMIPFIGCIDEIALNVETEERTLVVDGFVSDLEGSFQVKLSKSSVIGVGQDNILTPVPGVSMQLMDEKGVSYPYFEIEEGVYELTSFVALRDVDYFIDIVLADGRHYQSTPAKLRASSIISSISYEITNETFRNNAGRFVDRQIIAMKLETDVSGSIDPPYLRWRVEGEYALSENSPGALVTKTCYIPTKLDLNDVRVFDTSKLKDGKLFDQAIAETEYNYRFAEQFCYHISQFSISEDEFNYWSNIKEIIDINGGLFDPPPGTLIGNITNVEDPSDIAVGYFSVASVSFKREFINGGELKRSIALYCNTRSFRTIPFGCLECLDFQNAVATRPVYWEF